MDKSAKELFEEAGYFYDRHGNEIIIFETWLNGSSELRHNEILRFKLIDEMWWKLQFSKNLCLNFESSIDIKLFKAINKQIEEIEHANEI